MSPENCESPTPSTRCEFQTILQDPYMDLTTLTVSVSIWVCPPRNYFVFK